MSGHGCTGDRMLLEHERHYGLGMDALFSRCSWNKHVVLVSAWMLQKSNTLEPERYYGMGMDALVTVCSWKPNVIMVWACMLCSGTQSNLNAIMVSAWMLGDRMLLEHERYYGLGKDALVTMCSWNTNVVLVWAWMRGERRLLEHESY